MKSHPNYALRGGLKMKKNKAAKREKIPILSFIIPPATSDLEKIAMEEAARIYRESVMHQCLGTE